MCPGMKRIMSKIKPVFITGLVAGTLDGLAAVLMYSLRTGENPMNVFRFIASGVFGTEALAGGIPMAFAGIAFHYGIALGWTFLFFLLADRFICLTKNWIISGVVYGIFVWLIMNLIVIPISFVPKTSGPSQWLAIIKATLVLIVCIGLPIAYSARRFFKGTP